MQWPYLIACDVGVKYYAQAVFRDGVLEQARLVDQVQPVRIDWCGAVEREWRLVIEVATPRERDGKTKIREVNALNRSAGRLGALHPSPEFKLPEEWKAQLPKAKDQRRTLEECLTEDELKVLPKSKAELKHVLDAVGLGLFALGRRSRKCAPLLFEGEKT